VGLICHKLNDQIVKELATFSILSLSAFSLTTEIIIQAFFENAIPYAKKNFTRFGTVFAMRFTLYYIG
jgi:hypothetical protein